MGERRLLACELQASDKLIRHDRGLPWMEDHPARCEHQRNIGIFFIQRNAVAASPTSRSSFIRCGVTPHVPRASSTMNVTIHARSFGEHCGTTAEHYITRKAACDRSL